MDRQKDETIIRQGPIKHKDTTIRFSLDRWKPRIAVLKSLQAGRLQFILLDNKGVEKYQIPIEDYAGICINSKPDGNEKYSFALISERTTDVFAFETEEAMKRWVDVIQEKLGRVLIVNITIPYRQHQLKQGLAMLMLRDNAIVITTKEQPPKFQCSILIRHIKHYGDFDDGFVFETGNKCPKGENTFLIRCADNKKFYNLLDSLANRSTTVRDIVLKHEFSEIAVPQGYLPKTPILPNTHSPSFNFGNLSSQLHLRQNKHEIVNRKIRSVSDIPQSHAGHRLLANSTSVSALPYYNMETGQESYQNVGRDGQSIVPEVEYEIIPDDSFGDAFVEGRGIRPKRGTVPAHTKHPNYLNLQINNIKSATMKNPSKSQRDSEYINIDKPVVASEQNNCVLTSMAQGSSYANVEPISLSAAKHNHESTTEYVNLEFTESNTDGEALSPKVSTPSLPVNNASDVSSQNLDRPLGKNGHTTSKGQDEADGKTSVTPCDSKNTPKFLLSAEQTMHATAEVEYENVSTKTPSTDQLEYVMLSMVGVGQVTHPQTNPQEYKEIVSIKTPPSSSSSSTAAAAAAATPLPLEMATTCVSRNEPAKGYEDFVPVKTSPPPPSAGSPSDVTTVITKPPAAYKEFIPIKTPTADIELPSEITNEPVRQYEDFVPIKTADASLPLETTDEPAMEYEDFVPAKTPTAGCSLPSEMLTVGNGQYAQTESAAAYKELVSIKTPPSAAQTGSLPLDEPARGYEDFVPIKTSSSSNSERHSTREELISHGTNEEYSRLQFRGEWEDPTIEQTDSASTYSTLVHSASTGSSTSDSFYSKLDVSEVSKTGHHDHVSLKDKPQVPSRNLKKPMKLYEPSSDSITMIPPLPPRNRNLADSPTSPPAGPKPVVLPKSVTPPVTPPIGPKPITRDSRFHSELKYCDLEFTDIGQPRFRARSKQLIDQPLSSQHDAYAIIDRDASIGLQLALEQKKHDRR